MPPRRQLEDDCWHVSYMRRASLLLYWWCHFRVLWRLVRCCGVLYAAVPLSSVEYHVADGTILVFSRPSPLFQAMHYSTERPPSLYPWNFITVLYSCDACSVVLPLFDFDCMRCGLLPSSKIHECRLLICASHLAIHQLFVHVRGFGLLRLASLLQLRSLLGGHLPFYVIGPLPYSCDP